MKGFFNPKKSTKKQPSGDDTDPPPPFSPQHVQSHHQSRPSQSQSQATPSGSEPASPPVKPSPGPSRSPTKKISRPASPARAQREQQKSRSSRSFGRQPTDSSRRPKHDPNTHPLNLPPDEYRRLSALAAMTDRSSFDRMDVDKENSPQPPSSSPPPPQQQKSFTVPINSPTNGPKPDLNSQGPAPPPHRSNPSSPVPSNAEQAEGFKSLGNKSFKDRQYKKAIKEYSQAIELVPDSATYLSNRAAAFMSDGQYDAALEDCSRALDLDPHNAKFLLRLARIYTNLGRPDEAMTTFSRIHPPPSAKDMAAAREMQHHMKAAQDALSSGTSGSMVLHAIDQAEKLLAHGASRPRKWQLMRGNAYLKMGGANSLGEAQNLAMSLLRYNSQDPEALVLRGRALYAQGENDKAIQHFRKALSGDPDFRDAVKWLRTVQKLDRMKEDGNTEYKAGRWQSAFDKYTSALDVDPLNRGTNSKLLQNRALCRLKLRDYDGAIADCERAISLDNTYMKARKTKANALGQAEKWEAAVQEWKKIQELDPEDRTILKEIRKAELELKKSQRKDYYKILGITKDADESTIKKAYRKLAIIHHPDKNRDDEGAAERFKDIGEAYETLSDPQKRARYDSGEDLIDPSEMFSGGGGGMPGGIDPEILFSMMNGGGGAFGGGGGFPGGGFPGGGRARAQGGFPGGGFHHHFG
ncbi:putative small glutamine-rich tetratricopeptide repeat-containing protein A [Rosellinia necatrix]|uniref:Putative small glutamine-rich tetratricopeptide repeat-containing protein A n=1 Tax=Rosellinia necatrix TaxID=77044 RepID=A0A1W2THY1_ROSNE|nr:putative small glutamine-rich tetratricopeptide repeat-containing protein A [Rosellinia necatrix]